MAIDLMPENLEMLEEPATAGFFMPEEKHRLSKYIDAANIADELSEEDLNAIGQRCYQGYLADEKSREPKMSKIKKAVDLAMQTWEAKTFPWRNAANIKLPLITDAAIKFAARAYSEIIRDDKVVKGSIIGEDPDGMKQARADRVGDYMSWQLMEKECEWEADTDKLLHILPVTGHLFRKRYYCPSEVRTKSELRMPDKVVVSDEASSLESARRVTDIIENISHNDVVTFQRSGIWRDVDFKGGDKKPSLQEDATTPEDYYCFLEQCCWLDLDEDGYEEPYIVTLERDSTKVVRIAANYDADGIKENDKKQIVEIKPKAIYTDYIFMPSLDGGYYGMGFGQLMEPLTSAANGIINRLLDAGTLATIQGGFLSREIKVRGGRYTFEPNEWKRTESTADQLAKGIHALPTKEPSPTLFNLLGLVLELTKDLSSVSDVLAGDSPGMNVPATTVMALIEQGMKTFNAIYKRIYRSLKKEFKQLYRLNYEYSDEEEYFTVLDEQKTVMKSDFEADSLDVIPIADPNMSSDMQRLARAEALKGAIGMPGVDPRPIMVLWMEAMRIPSDLIEQILPEQDPNGVPPHVQQMMHDAEMKMADVANKERELELKEREFEVKAMETISKAIKNLADAEAAESGQQMAVYQQIANNILQQEKLNVETRRMGSMGEQPGNPTSPQQANGTLPGFDGAIT